MLVIDNSPSKNGIWSKIFESNNFDRYPINPGLGFFEIMSSKASNLTVPLSRILSQPVSCDIHRVIEAVITLGAFMP